MVDRRRFLIALGAMATSRAFGQYNPKPRFGSPPFTLGVASGYPQPTGCVLWTRLAPVPFAPNGGMPAEVVPVGWEVARDEAMKNIVAHGTAYATPEWAHSVHVEVNGLQSSRPHWYRFTAGDAVSPIGRTHTAPGAQARPTRMRFAFVSCQHYEQGYFNAYRHVVADEPELVLHLGDYIYEASWGRDLVRSHGAGEAVTLGDYRRRYALYKTDPDLQSAHAACPWLVTWDDHEVENDYADDRSEQLDTPEWFLARRAAAYKAWYEHMPVPRSMLPYGPHARIYTRSGFGSLVNFLVLDDRQFRSYHACPRPGRGGSNSVDPTQCAELGDPKRTMLGARQEQWLDAALGASRARWNVIAQQTRMAQMDEKPGPGRSAWTDSWDGYPAARKKLLESLAKTANPVVIGGDIHAFNVSQLKLDFDDPASPVVAAEFVGTSVTSQAWAQERLDALRPDNPHVLLADSRYRGYVRVDVT
ncbi:MAG TPA: alkaline phosphatase D family protein, partial [Burkholderiales bacterium]|nr:alkaline phosphatase D family protein [Burkholderiales bacterium]